MEQHKIQQLIDKPLKAIRAKCLDCCCGQEGEVRKCPVLNCPLYAFRFGRNPYRKKREYTEKQRQTMLESLAKARKAKQEKIQKGEHQ